MKSPVNVDVDLFAVALAAVAIWFAPLSDGTSLARATLHHLTDGQVSAFPPEEIEE